MLRLILRVFIDVLLGLAAAGVLLAVIVPLLIRRHVIAPGDVTGAAVIAAVLTVAVAAMLLRPAGALKRRDTPNE